MGWDDIFDRFRYEIRSEVASNSKIKGLHSKLDLILRRLDDIESLIQKLHDQEMKQFNFDVEDQAVLDMTNKVAEAKARIPQ